MSLPSSSASHKSLQECVCPEEGIASPSLASAMAGLGCSCKKCTQKYPCQAALVGLGKPPPEEYFGLLWFGSTWDSQVCSFQSLQLFLRFFFPLSSLLCISLRRKWFITCLGGVAVVVTKSGP